MAAHSRRCGTIADPQRTVHRPEPGFELERVACVARDTGRWWLGNGADDHHHLDIDLDDLNHDVNNDHDVADHDDDARADLNHDDDVADNYDDVADYDVNNDVYDHNNVANDYDDARADYDDDIADYDYDDDVADDDYDDDVADDDYDVADDDYDVARRDRPTRHVTQFESERTDSPERCDPADRGVAVYLPDCNHPRAKCPVPVERRRSAN